MKSKVQPSADYWTEDVKMTSKVQPAADYGTVERKKNLETRLCYLWWAEKQREKWQNSFKNEEVLQSTALSIFTFGSDGAIPARALFKKAKQMATLPDQPNGIVNVFP